MFLLLSLILFNFSSALNIDNLQVANIAAEDLINPTNENAASQTHFLLMLDTSNAMASNGKLDHMKTFAINWLMELGQRPGTVVAVVHYGNDATMMSAWVPVESALNQLVDKISKLSASGGDACTVCGLKMAELLMLEASDSKRTVLSITGQQDGSVGGSIADSSVWEPFKMGEIPIQTILYGIEGFALQVLTTETLGKYYSMMDYSRDNSALTDGKYYSMMDYTRDNSALTDVSKTFVPAVVGDGYEWVLAEVTITGTHCIIMGACKADFMVSDSPVKNVKIYIRIASHDDIDDLIDTIVITDESGNSMDGWNFSIDQMKNEIVLSKPLLEPGKYGIDIYIKHHSVEFILQVKVTADHTSTSTEPYIVECKHPTEMQQGQFLISSQVKQGYSNRVSGATVAARITLSLEDDPTGKENRPCFVHLSEYGLDVNSGDVASLDGVYSYILDPRRECFDGPVDNSVIERMTVICNMMASSGSRIDENTFWE